MGTERFPGRYDRNKQSISDADQRLLAEKRVCVIGCGGLGGGLIEGLARVGVGHITAVDCDVFENSNLNRQVLSNEMNIGRPKALEAMRQMREINSEVAVTAVSEKLTETNAEEIIGGHDLVVDALDNVKARLLLEDVCEAQGIPLIHGAIEGWSGEVSVVLPGQRTLRSIYGEAGDDADVKPVEGNPAFTPAAVSAIEVAESVKMLLGKGSILEGKLLIIDLMNHDHEVIDL